jgi:hypothetical protein
MNTSYIVYKKNLHVFKSYKTILTDHYFTNLIYEEMFQLFEIEVSGDNIM